MESRIVSQFSIREKNTPQTALHTTNRAPNHQFTPSSCPFCVQHLATTTNLRKNEILLELKIEQLQAEMSQLQKENLSLVNQKVLTYSEYQEKVEGQNSQYWNRQDIEAELFQARIIIELLLVTTSAHPQIKYITDESLKEKYSQTLLQNIRLKEMVDMRDKILEEKEMFPIYRYDKRLETLKKAIGYWYNKAEKDCKVMKEKVRQMKTAIEEEKGIFLHEIKKEFGRNKEVVFKALDAFEQQHKKIKKQQKKPKIVASPPQQKEKPEKSRPSKQLIALKKFR